MFETWEQKGEAGKENETYEETIHLKRIVFLVKNVNSLRTNVKERRKWRVKVYSIYIYYIYSDSKCNQVLSWIDEVNKWKKLKGKIDTCVSVVVIIIVGGIRNEL